MTLIYRIFIFVLFLISLPLQCCVGLCVFLFSEKPILYKQKRIGQFGKPFVMYKFRTMIQNAEKSQNMYKNKNEADGPVFKIHDDPRFTVIGKFLSHTGLDELPQIWNVLRGDMAFFGPRPLPVSEARKLLLWQKKRQCIKPGIVSPWVLDGYHTRTFDQWMRSDCQYVKKKNFCYDMKLFFRSLIFMMRLLFREAF